MKSDRPAIRLEGVVPIVPTPFTADEKIDTNATGRLIDFAVACGSNAVCLPAYASEFYKLSEDEKQQLVDAAVKQAAGRIPVIAQANHPSALHAASAATAMQALNADLIAVAVPRLFPLSESDLFRYFDRILRAIDIPLLIQDFHPGGTSVSPKFVADLNRLHPHFQYIKLEEPRMAPKIQAIREATGDAVGVLEGWGGMYMLELIPVGAAGTMPSLALADVLSRIYRLLKSGESVQAYELFGGVLPHIAYGLQSLEFFHHLEKLLLVERGVLESVVVRDATVELNAFDCEHMRFLNDRVFALLERFGMPRNPLQKPLT